MRVVQRFLCPLAIVMMFFMALPTSGDANQAKTDKAPKPIRLPKDLPEYSLIVLIRESPLEEALPYILELIKRLESEDELTPNRKSVLGELYFHLARYHFNQFAATSEDKEADLCVEFAEKFRKLVPDSLQSAEVTHFQVLCHQSRQQWSVLEGVLKDAIAAVDQGLYGREHYFEWLESLCSLYGRESNWEEGEPYFVRLFQSIKASLYQRAVAAIYLLQTYEDQILPEKSLPLLPFLAYAKEKRNDPNLNLSLFKLGNQFSDQGDFTEANYLYFLCLSLEEIIDFEEKLLEKLRRREAYYVSQNLEVPRDVSFQVKSKTQYMQDLRSQNSYTAPLKFHRARNLERMGRHYDAFFGYVRLLREHPEYDNIQLFHYSAFNQAIKVAYDEEMLSLGEDYLADKEYKRFEKEVSAKLIAKCFKLENYNKVIAHGERFINTYPTHAYSLSIVHFMCMSWVRLEQLEQIPAKIGPYIIAHPTAPAQQSGRYWLGLVDIINQEYDPAVVHYDYIIEKHPDGPFYKEALFRRAVCEFGLGDYEATEERFTDWVSRYPDDALRGEAEMFLGDVDAYYARVEEALDHYQAIEKYTGKMNLINHGYFEGARLLEANEQYEAVVELLMHYSDKYSEDGNLAQATYLIGKSYESMGHPEKMLSAYFAAIVKFGNQVGAEGVDEIIPKFSEKYQQHYQGLQQTMFFLKQFIEDEDFRIELMEDRKELHNYKLEHPHIARDLMDALLRDRQLREGLLPRPIARTPEEIEAGLEEKFDRTMLPASKVFLVDHLKNTEREFAVFPKIPPSERFMNLYKAAKDQSQRTLMLRLARVFMVLDMELPERVVFTANDLPLASPATLAWMASEVLDEDEELALLAIERVLQDFPFSKAVPDAKIVHAEYLLRQNQYAQAVAIFDDLVEANPLWPDAGKTALRAASLYRQRGDLPEALRRYLEILKIREWRGPIWAETCLRIGQCFEAMDEPLKAHGYYERTYLSYRQFTEFSSQALYLDGLLLERMNELDSARSVYETFMSLPNAQALAQFNSVQNRYDAL